MTVAAIFTAQRSQQQKEEERAAQIVRENGGTITYKKGLVGSPHVVAISFAGCPERSPNGFAITAVPLRHDNYLNVLAVLPTFRRLEDLELLGNPVDDRAIPHLMRIRSLRRLGLDFTDVTDEGVVKLATCIRLEDVRTRCEHVTSRVEGILRNSLPMCRVVTSADQATLVQWFNDAMDQRGWERSKRIAEYAVLHFPDSAVAQAMREKSHFALVIMNGEPMSGGICAGPFGCGGCIDERDESVVEDIPVKWRQP